METCRSIKDLPTGFLARQKPRNFAPKSTWPGLLHRLYWKGCASVPDDTKREEDPIKSDELGYPRADKARKDQRVPSAKVVLNRKAQARLCRPQRLVDESVPGIHRSLGERL